MSTPQSRTADSPGRQLARVKNGQAVGVITLPSRHRILGDGRYGKPNQALIARINASGAYCWDEILYASALEKYLKRANGQIATASNRDDCDGWPSRYSDIGGDKR